MTNLWLTATTLGALIVSWPSQATADDPGPQKACDLHRTNMVTMKYLLCLPKDYEQKASWPLLLFLHGSGEAGDDLTLVKKHGPPKLIDAGQHFPFIVLSPQCPTGRWWQPMELATLLDEIVEKYKVDQDRIYVTGLSMGGFGTWMLAAYQPNRFAALVPICGGGEVYWSDTMVHIPVWVFHGGKDTAVPVERSERMAEALKKHGGNVKLTIYPEAGHDAWSQAYASPELYDWLLQQKRTVKNSDASAKTPGPAKAASEQPANVASDMDQKTTTLAEALRDWIALLESNDLETAQKRWAKESAAKEGMKRWWDKLKECNKQYDYRKWLDGAKQIGSATQFKLGGHSYNHMHVDWEKTENGWRIASVWLCR